MFEYKIYQMHYDPVKRSLGTIFNKSPFLRKIFYNLLDLLLLRAWHIHKELRLWMKNISHSTIHPIPGSETEKWRSGEAEKNKISILDAGAGFGQYSYWLSCKSNTWQILSVDVKDEQVADCNNFFQTIDRKNVKFEVGDLTKFVRENNFDLAISVDVMEHILEDVFVFKNIYASLKQGGMLLISTPSDQGGSDVQEHGETSFIGEHVRDGYNIREIQDKLRSAGFSKAEARYSYGTPGKISWHLSMKYPMQMLGVTKLFFILLPFYYLITYPIAYLLNYLDINTNHKTGTGLIVKAWK